MPMSRLPKAPRYFGCVGPAGHYVYNPGMGHDRDMNWLAYMDGLLPPEGDQIEGLARLHHFNGCTVLAFWDRSGDKRPGSNSVFYVPGHATFDEVVEAAKKSFPGIWRRFPFNIVLDQKCVTA
jgi:hypothetical protein